MQAGFLCSLRSTVIRATLWTNLWKRILCVFAVLLSAPVLAVTCPVKSAPDAPEAFSQFHFLVGVHEMDLHAWTGHAWTPPRPQGAHWRGWVGLDGHAIYDEWVDMDPRSGGLGVNVRVYDEAEALWKMMWVSTNGLQVQDLRAQMIDDVLTMWQVYPQREGWKAEFTQLSEHSWQRIDYNKDANGIWQPGFKLVATRTACKESRE